MGGKQTGERKHFLFYITCIIIILYSFAFSGCALKANLTQMETQDLMSRGEYSQALEKDQQLLKEYPQMGDKALFQIGLIYAHPENPDKDYNISLKYFRSLIEEYPDSRLINNAQIWISLLNKVTKRDKRCEEQQLQLTSLIEKINLINKENLAKDKKIDELKKDLQLKDKKIDEIQKENQLKDNKADELLKQIEKLKEIDLNIQKKKRSVSLK